MLAQKSNKIKKKDMAKQSAKEWVEKTFHEGKQKKSLGCPEMNKYDKERTRAVSGMERTTKGNNMKNHDTKGNEASMNESIVNENHHGKKELTDIATKNIEDENKTNVVIEGPIDENSDNGEKKYDEHQILMTLMMKIGGS